MLLHCTSSPFTTTTLNVTSVCYRVVVVVVVVLGLPLPPLLRLLLPLLLHLQGVGEQSSQGGVGLGRADEVVLEEGQQGGHGGLLLSLLQCFQHHWNSEPQYGHDKKWRWKHLHLEVLEALIRRFFTRVRAEEHGKSVMETLFRHRQYSLHLVALCAPSHLQQPRGGGPGLRVLHQTLTDKVPEGVGPEVRGREGRGWVGGDHEDGLKKQSHALTWGRGLVKGADSAPSFTHPHGVDVGVGRFALGHLQRRDAQRPDVGHAVVADLLDDFRRHPEGGADHRVPLGHGVLGIRSAG